MFANHWQVTSVLTVDSKAEAWFEVELLSVKSKSRSEAQGLIPLHILPQLWLVYMEWLLEQQHLIRGKSERHDDLGCFIFALVHRAPSSYNALSPSPKFILPFSPPFFLLFHCFFAFLILKSISSCLCWLRPSCLQCNTSLTYLNLFYIL